MQFTQSESCGILINSQRCFEHPTWFAASSAYTMGSRLVAGRQILALVARVRVLPPQPTVDPRFVWISGFYLRGSCRPAPEARLVTMTGISQRLLAAAESGSITAAASHCQRAYSIGSPPHRSLLGKQNRHSCPIRLKACLHDLHDSTRLFRLDNEFSTIFDHCAYVSVEVEPVHSWIWQC